MAPWIGGLFSLVGTIFGGMFQTKQAKMEAYATSAAKIISLLKAANYTDAQIAQAVSSAVVADSQSESILARNWRPLTMLGISVMLIAWMFGLIPPNINSVMPPFISDLFEILKIGLCGYIPARSLEKIARMFMTPKIVESLVKSLTK